MGRKGMEQNGHSREFRLRYSEVDDRGELTPVALLNIIEETASSHCDESGWGVFRLMEEGYGWVLLRGGFEMSRYPRYREDFRVETWISRARRFEAYRENRIVSSTGEVLGTARALWLFYDIAKHRPASIFEDILKVWAPGGQAASGMDLSEIDGPAPGAEGRAAESDFAVRRADIDTNGHVNNVVYLSWALEALPKATREGAYLSSLRGQFKRELKLGACAMPLCADEGEGKFRLGVIASPGSPAEEGSYMAAAAESLWRPRLSA